MEMHTIKDMAKEVGVGESTIRFWRDRHEEFIPCIGKGRKRRYPKEALETLRFIAACSAEGKNGTEINELLSSKYKVIDIHPENAAAAQQGAPEPMRPETSFFLASMKKSLAQGFAALMRKLDPLDRLEDIQEELKRSNAVHERTIAMQQEKLSHLEDHIAELNAKMDRLHKLQSRTLPMPEAPEPPGEKQQEAAPVAKPVLNVVKPQAPTPAPEKKLSASRKRAGYKKEITERIVFLKEVRGKNYQEITEALNAKKFPSFRGGPWHMQAVAMIHQVEIKKKTAGIPGNNIQPAMVNPEKSGTRTISIKRASGI